MEIDGVVLSPDQEVKVFCVVHGHSRLMDMFLGYHSCVRCGAQLGDSLGGFYSNSQAVYVHHMHVFTHKRDVDVTWEELQANGCNCPENAEKLTEMDFKHVAQWSSWGYEQRPPWRKQPREEWLGKSTKPASE